MNNILLGLNIDHVATLRQQRGTPYPAPVEAAQLSAAAGADIITMHLREDRRHIQDYDVDLVKNAIQIPINLEMAITPEMLDYAVDLKPKYCCLVPERREELTTEGGLNVVDFEEEVKDACSRLADAGIDVSLFIDPDKLQLEAALRCKAPTIEIHTGHYADAVNVVEQRDELKKIDEAAKWAKQAGFNVNAGHGLYYLNVQPIAAIADVSVLHIGHGVIARAIAIGLPESVREIKRLMIEARNG